MADFTFEPNTFYDMIVSCVNPECANSTRQWAVNLVYTNNGQPNIKCGVCNQPVDVIVAAKTDPQPEIS